MSDAENAATARVAELEADGRSPREARGARAQDA
jgi:hypothetical protein